MSIVSYGPAHRWFAWKPVWTTGYGWKWLRFVTRRHCHLDMFGAPTFWVYDL